MGFQVGLQESMHGQYGFVQADKLTACAHVDTCDPSWQSTRDALITTAHVISDLAFLVEVVAAGFLVAAICCGKYCKFILEIILLMQTIQLMFWPCIGGGSKFKVGAPNH